MITHFNCKSHYDSRWKIFPYSLLDYRMNEWITRSHRSTALVIPVTWGTDRRNGMKRTFQIRYPAPVSDFNLTMYYFWSLFPPPSLLSHTRHGAWLFDAIANSSACDVPKNGMHHLLELIFNRSFPLSVQWQHILRILSFPPFFYLFDCLSL